MKSLVCILVFLLALTSCQQQPQQPTSQLHRFADIVYVIDEGLPREVMMWIDSSVMQLENRLTSSSIGDQSNMPNLYGLVLFGGQRDNVRRILTENNQLSKVEPFSNNIRDSIGNLVPTESTHDGYAGLDEALNTMWRPRSNRVIIFITDHERDVVFPNITTNILITRMVDTQVSLNVILNLSIEALIPPSGQNMTAPPVHDPAFGVIYSNDSFAYYTNPSSHNLETAPFSRILGTNGIVYDYAILPALISSQVYGLPIPSSVWQLSYTLNNNTAEGQAFNDAFFHNSAFEVQNANLSQIPCQTCQGDNCFYLAQVLLPRLRAPTICANRGGQLANLNDQNAINTIRNVYSDTFWINGFQNNSNGCLAVVANNSSSVDCNSLHPVLCQVQRSLVGC